MQMKSTKIATGRHHIQVLGFANYFNFLGGSAQDSEKVAQVLEQAANKAGMKIDSGKIKIMELLDNGHNTDTGSLTFKKSILVSYMVLRSCTEHKK